MILTLEECRQHLAGFKLTDEEVKELHDELVAISNALLDELFAAPKRKEENDEV